MSESVAKNTVPAMPTQKKKKGSTWKRMVRCKWFYLMMLPALLCILLFNYIPLYGVVLAFKQYTLNVPKEMFGIDVANIPILRFFAQVNAMEWVGFKWFNNLFVKQDFWAAVKNTLIISFGRLIFEFPIPVILALAMNEVKNSFVKRFYQTVYTFPHFLSWILVIGVLNGFLQSDGVINQVREALGMEKINFLANPTLFRPIIFITSDWKEMGWSSIIYLATISGIDPTLYEAAYVDGANRWHCVRFITWPSIRPTVVLLLIMQCGSILNGGFDQIFNLYNPAVYEVGDILDTWIYRYTFQSSGRNFSVSVATGFFKSAIGFILVMGADRVAKWLGEDGLL